MPLVKIEILKGHSAKYKKALMDAVHDALVQALGIPDWDRYQRLYELDRKHFDTGKSVSDGFCIIELTIYPGRSRETKADIIDKITGLLYERFKLPPEDIFIVIHDPPAENWGIGGVQREDNDG